MSNAATTISRTRAAEIIGVAPYTLKLWGMNGRGPRFMKLGREQQSRTLYRTAEIQKWQRDPTAYEQRHRGPQNDRHHNPGT